MQFIIILSVASARSKVLHEEQIIILTNVCRAISLRVVLSFAFSQPFRQHRVYTRRWERWKGRNEGRPWVKKVEILVFRSRCCGGRRFSGGGTIMDFFNKRPRLNSFDQFSRANSHPPRPRPTFNPAAPTPFSRPRGDVSRYVI